MTIKPDELIPPDSELAQLLMQWTEDSDTRTWNVANLTNDLIEELFADNGGIATRQDIYKAVATRCKGKKPNTIRRWAECAADFPPKIQKKYASLLSFDHFKTSRRLFKEGYTPSIDYGLEWCVSGNDMKLSAGKFHTVGEMLNQFLPEETFGNQAQKIWEKVKDKLYDQIVIEDNDTKRAKLMSSWHDMDDVWGIDKPSST